jgi:hypothetical protein
MRCFGVGAGEVSRMRQASPNYLMYPEERDGWMDGWMDVASCWRMLWVEHGRSGV